MFHVFTSSRFPPPMHRKRLAFIGILAVGVFVLLVGLRDITSSHEGRVAQTARTMADSGWPWDATPVEVPAVQLHDRNGVIRLAPGPEAQTIRVNPWMIPVLDGQIRLQKPPLPYWCDAVLFRLMGRSALSARLVPALLGFLATFLLYDLAKMLLGRRLAWFAALLWLSSYFIPEEYRKTMADPYLAFFTLGCVWAWVRGSLTVGRGPLAGRARPMTLGQRPTANGQLFCFYLFLALGLLAKGPPLIAHLVIATGAFHLCYRRRLPGRGWNHVTGILLTLLIALPWTAYVVGHVPHVIEVWRYQSVGELTDNTRNARDWWFYFPQLFLLALPWIGLWILGIIRPFVGRDSRGSGFRVQGSGEESSDPNTEYRIPNPESSALSSAAPHRGRGRLRPFFPLIWYAATIAFFSLAHMKKNAYLLPAMPAQALLMAQGAMLLAVWLKRKPREQLPRLIVAAQAVVGLAFALWLGWVLLLSEFRQPLPIGLLLFLIALIAAAYPLWKALTVDRWPNRAGTIGGGPRPTTFPHWLAAQSVAYAILLSLFFNFYDAPKNNADSPRPFIEAITPRLLRPSCALARLHLDPAAAFYLPDGLEPFDPAAPCVNVILERSPKAPAPQASDFDYLHLRDPIVEIESLQLPRFNRWRLFSLKTRPATQESFLPAPPPAPGAGRSHTPAAGSSSTGSPADPGNF
jgi:4-amino-4-deoxy-L-arabinose transferase-like glycosyltransferase